MNAAHTGIEYLDTAQCWELLESRSFGRLAVQGRDGMPDVFPLNYTVHDEAIYVRTGRGTKLMDIAIRPEAAFEIDGEDASFCWSVVVRGTARRLDIDAEIHASGVLKLVSASPASTHTVICVTPSSVTGRRFENRSNAAQSFARPPIVRVPASVHEPTRPYEYAEMFPRTSASGSARPHPIPHYPPLSEG